MWPWTVVVEETKKNNLLSHEDIKQIIIMALAMSLAAIGLYILWFILNFLRQIGQVLQSGLWQIIKNFVSLLLTMFTCLNHLSSILVAIVVVGLAIMGSFAWSHLSIFQTLQTLWPIYKDDLQAVLQTAINTNNGR